MHGLLYYSRRDVFRCFDIKKDACTTMFVVQKINFNGHKLFVINNLQRIIVMFHVF